MIPIHQLLSRIRWDPEFGKGEFTLGYLDRVEKRLVYVSFKEVTFDESSQFSLEVVGEDGELQTIGIPFHRVREVYRDGELIWQRPEPG